MARGSPCKKGISRKANGKTLETFVDDVQPPANCLVICTALTCNSDDKACIFWYLKFALF